MAGARLIYASSRDHFLPSVFAKLHPTRRTPDNAMILQAAITTMFILFGGGFRSTFDPRWVWT
jgi:amino acid transporter